MYNGDQECHKFIVSNQREEFISIQRVNHHLIQTCMAKKAGIKSFH